MGPYHGGLFGARNGQKAKIVIFWAPFGLLGGPGTAETGRLAPKTLPHSVPGWYASISCAWAPYGTPRAPKRARFGPERPFWGPRRSLGSPGWPNLGPSAALWSNWFGLIVTTYFDLVLGPFVAAKGPKRPLF